MKKQSKSTHLKTVLFLCFFLFELFVVVVFFVCCWFFCFVSFSLSVCVCVGRYGIVVIVLVFIC